MSYNLWNKDMDDSVIALKSIMNTYLPKIVSGKIHQIEHIDNEVLLLMDIKSGIDYIKSDSNGLQGIAARVQWESNFDTFTIRANRCTGNKTELEKRLYQIKNGYLYPYLTLQAYFDCRNNNILLSIAVIKTFDLYNLYKTQPTLFYCNSSDNDFVYVHWNDMLPYIKCIKYKPDLENTEIVGSGEF